MILPLRSSLKKNWWLVSSCSVERVFRPRQTALKGAKQTTLKGVYAPGIFPVGLVRLMHKFCLGLAFSFYSVWGLENCETNGACSHAASDNESSLLSTRSSLNTKQTFPTKWHEIVKYGPCTYLKNRRSTIEGKVETFKNYPKKLVRTVKETGHAMIGDVKAEYTKMTDSVKTLKQFASDQAPTTDAEGEDSAGENPDDTSWLLPYNDTDTDAENEDEDFDDLDDDFDDFGNEDDDDDWALLQSKGDEDDDGLPLLQSNGETEIFGDFDLLKNIAKSVLLKQAREYKDKLNQLLEEKTDAATATIRNVINKFADKISGEISQVDGVLAIVPKETEGVDKITKNMNKVKSMIRKVKRFYNTLKKGIKTRIDKFFKEAFDKLSLVDFKFIDLEKLKADGIGLMVGGVCKHAQNAINQLTNTVLRETQKILNKANSIIKYLKLAINKVKAKFMKVIKGLVSRVVDPLQAIIGGGR